MIFSLSLNSYYKSIEFEVVTVSVSLLDKEIFKVHIFGS